MAAQFIGQLYDLFVEHRGLVMTLWASDSMSEEELAEAGIADIKRALAVLGRISAEGMDIQGHAIDSPRPGGALDGGDGRRDGRVPFDLLRRQAAVAKGHRRGAHASDPPRLPASRPLRGRERDRLHFEVLLEAGDAVLTADPARLVATERDLCTVRGRAVEADAPGPEATGHAERPFE